MLRTVFFILAVCFLTLFGAIVSKDSKSASSSSLAIVESPSYLTFDYNKGVLSFGDFKKLLVNVVGYSTKEVNF